VTTTEFADARSTLVQTGHLLNAAGLSPGSTGNLSVRVGGQIICTPTGARLATLVEDQLSVITIGGEPVSGPKATKETFMHRAMYDADPNLGGVVHLHSPYATAVSCLADLDAHDAVPALTPYLTMRAGTVQLVPYFAPGDPAAAAPISRAVTAGRTAILLQNHGSIVGAVTLDAAASVAQELEESARLQIITAGLAVRPLTADQRRALLTAR
jgi:ribulose-5-phosphate 4-epimerase/fuculose-1-phosphate aldolase